MKIKHPDADFADATVQLMWKCFYYYAYHPFPSANSGGKVEWAAFQRAVSLLALQCTKILGTQDEGAYFWRSDHNDASFQKRNFARVFRSIGAPITKGNESLQMEFSSADMLNDTMDVLAMTQPHTIKMAPSPDQLRSAAQNLLAESAIPMQYTVTREDLSALLSLLSRLRLHTATWGSGFKLGTFEKAIPVYKELADITVNGLGGDQEGNLLSPDQREKVMDLLVSIYCVRWTDISDLSSQICNYDSINFGRRCFSQR